LYSTFLGLETARRGLATARVGMDVTGHNVANANTTGYTRQRANQVASDPYTMPSMGKPVIALQLGTGVLVSEIRRVRDNFLDGQIRTETSKLGYWQAQSDALSEIETVFSEPSDDGLSALLENFWSSWQELSKNAESTPIRTALLQNAISLANGFNHTYSQLETIKGDLNQLTEIYVDDINSKARQIEDLNKQIILITAAGDQPNDLLDKRDLLLDEMAELTNFTVTNLEDGSIQVQVGSLTLVDGASCPDQLDASSLDWTEVTSGALAGINQALNKLQGYEDSLNNLVGELINQVNTLHSSGYDVDGNAVSGTDYEMFFTGSNASDIKVNSYIEGDVTKIAASSIGNTDPNWGPANGNNALLIAQLQYATTIDGTTFDNYFNNLITKLGVESQEGERMTENQQVLVNQLTSRRESISGVSLDEEMTNLIQYQYAYQGAARVVTVLDSLLDTLINRMAV